MWPETGARQWGIEFFRKDAKAQKRGEVVARGFPSLLG